MRFFTDMGEVFALDGQEVELSVRNPLFGGERSGTLEVSVPLDLDRNREVFGWIGRPDVCKPVEWVECVAVAGGRSLRGALAVVEVDCRVAKVQFVEGVRKFGDDWVAPVDRLFVNELDLGEYPVTDPAEVSPLVARRGVEGAVAYPWLALGTDVVFNLAVSHSEWHEDTKRLTWQKGLLDLCDGIAAGVGYSLVFPSEVRVAWADALVCNTLPPSWLLTGFARALPRWTVREWFERLGPFLRGVFEVDDSLSRIEFVPYSELLERAGVCAPVVVDEYSCAVARDEVDADFAPLLRHRYRAQEATIWKYLDAPWLRDSGWEASVRETVADLFPSGRGDGRQLIYCREIDTYFVWKNYVIYSEGRTSAELAGKYPYAHLAELVAVDVFGPEVWSRTEDTAYEELEVCPVCVDWVFEGRVMQLPVSQLSEADYSGGVYDSGDVSLGHGVTLSNGVILSDSSVRSSSRIEGAIEGYDEERGETGYFDCVLVGFRNPDPDSFPYPVTDYVHQGGGIAGVPRMRLRGASSGVAVDPHVKYSFSFVASSLPDWRGVFVFHGQRFLCRELRVATVGGRLSGLVHGDFYRLVDS